MKRAFITGLLVIGTACMILACGKKEKETNEQKPETELSDGGTEETDQEEAEDQENAGEDDAQAEETPDEGAENYQIIGEDKIHFDDREEVLASIEKVKHEHDNFRRN